MTRPAKTRSILAAECGSATTTVILIDQTDQGYRLVATSQTPSTHVPPWLDITLGVQEATRHIEKQVSRRLLTPGGWPITPQTSTRQGVDVFVAVVSAGEPLRVLLAGLSKDFSLDSGRQAAASTYTHVTGMIALDHQDKTPEAHIQTALSEKPDVILLTGGINGGSTQPVIETAQLIALGLQLTQETAKPKLVFAGNNELRSAMADILGPLVALTSVDNVRPFLDYEDLHATRAELENLYLETKLTKLPGFDKLKNWSQHQLMPAGKAFEHLVTFLSQFHHLNVLGAAIGSQSTLLSMHNGDSLPQTTIRSDIGLGQSLPSLLEHISVEQIHRWLPFDFSLSALDHYLLNKCIYPTTIPTSPEDLMIEHATAREALRLVKQQVHGDSPFLLWNMIIGAGKPFTGAPQAAHAAMLLMDGLEPWGVTTLMLDKSSIIHMLGSIAAAAPEAAVQIAENDTFLNLGTVIAPAGLGTPHKPALKLTITYSDNRKVDHEVLFGQINTLPLPAGQKAIVEIRPNRQLDIGLGQPGRGAVAEVEGGLLGIIIDARGRPLRFPTENNERRRQIQQWLKALDINYAPPVR
jgi:hypothetical protein